MLLSCSHCAGFVPPNLTACPHCDAKLLDVKANSKFGSMVKTVTAAATGGLVAVTLMACYGGPPSEFDDNDVDGFGFDDCNDFDATINPGASDPLGDGIDQNCDGVDGLAFDGGSGSSSSSGGPCTTCNDAVKSTGFVPPASMFCTPLAEEQFNTLKECACTTGCSATCGANICMGLAPDLDCSNCIQDACSKANLDCGTN
jgi:hypothetical protein